MRKATTPKPTTPTKRPQTGRNSIQFERLDRRNFICKKRRKTMDKEGNVQWEIIGYYGTLQKAVLGALNDGYEGADSKALLESISKSEACVLQALKELKLRPELLEVKETASVKEVECVRVEDEQESFLEELSKRPPLKKKPKSIKDG